MNVIKLKSSDGKIFDTNLEIVKCSSLIISLLKNCETVDDHNSSTSIVPLPKVSSKILAKILLWAKYHKDDDPTMMTKEDAEDKFIICAWDKEFFQVDQRTLFDIIMAADYLDIKQLLLAASKTVANIMTNKTPQEMRAIFNIPNDFQPTDEDL